MSAIQWVTIGIALAAIVISTLSVRSSRRTYLRSCARLGVRPLTFWQVLTQRPGRRP